MPKRKLLFTAFMASPSDLEDERVWAQEVVDELNITWRSGLNMGIDLLKWETYATPGVAEYTQDVVNRSIGDDYDIFIGLLWTRFGTATPVASSGTAEEFERAIRRHQDHGKRVEILFYFKDTPIAPSPEISYPPKKISEVSAVNRYG